MEIVHSLEEKVRRLSTIKTFQHPCKEINLVLAHSFRGDFCYAKNEEPLNKNVMQFALVR